MYFFVAFLFLIIFPIAGISSIGTADFTTVVLFLFGGFLAWFGVIRIHKQKQEKKNAKARKKQTSRKRNEDDFLNGYGYIDNSAFGSIQSFTNHDKNSK